MERCVTVIELCLWKQGLECGGSKAQINMDKGEKSTQLKKKKAILLYVTNCPCLFLGCYLFSSSCLHDINRELLLRVALYEGAFRFMEQRGMFTENNSVYSPFQR